MERANKKIAVIGSANMDYTFEVETREGAIDKKNAKPLLKSPGGKGANQSVAASKLGADVSFIGCVGDDKSSNDIVENLKNNNVDYEGVKILENTNSDGRHIYLDSTGGNQMFGFGDAIKSLDVEWIKQNIDKLGEADLVMIQLKMPEESIKFVVQYCEENSKQLIVNPAPENRTNILTKNNLMDKISYITPNEEEAYYLSMFNNGIEDPEEIRKSYESSSKEEKDQVYEKLLVSNPNVIVTLGKRGAMYVDNGDIKIKEAYKTDKELDPTGCGDTFNAAFAVKNLEGANTEKAIDFANRAASINIEHNGAQIGMPTYEKVEQRANNYIDR